MGFFERLFGKNNSARDAKERLQLVLIHERTDLTPAELDSLNDDLIETISRHIEIDPQAMRIGCEHDGRSQRLVADIPLKARPAAVRGKQASNLLYAKRHLMAVL